MDQLSKSIGSRIGALELGQQLQRYDDSTIEASLDLAPTPTSPNTGGCRPTAKSWCQFIDG
jgi:hypothetical protein